MTTAVIADVHIHNFKIFGGQSLAGINSRCNRTIEALAGAVRRANKAECFRLVVCGDLFDVDSPPPQVLARVREVLEEFNGQVILLVGNHDQSSTLPGDHALGVLRSKSVQVIEKPTRIGDSLFLPFRPEPVIEWLEHEIKEHRGVKEVYAHFGVADEDTPPFLQDAHDAVHISVLERLIDAYDLSAVVVGNWHNHQSWSFTKGIVVQVGALVPTGFDNPGVWYGNVVLLQGTTYKCFEIKGPRFISVPWDRLEVMDQIDSAIGNAVYLNVTVEPGEAKEALEWFQSYQGDTDVINVRIVPNRKTAEERARHAAKVSSQAMTLQEAVVSYVGARKDLWARLKATGLEDEIVRCVATYLEGGV